MFFIAPPDFEGHHHPPPPAFERSAYESHRTTTIIIPPAAGVNEVVPRPRQVTALAQRGLLFPWAYRSLEALACPADHNLPERDRPILGIDSLSLARATAAEMIPRPEQLVITSGNRVVASSFAMVGRPDNPLKIAADFVDYRTVRVRRL
jgi:hypothetical protein